MIKEITVESGGKQIIVKDDDIVMSFEHDSDWEDGWKLFWIIPIGLLILCVAVAAIFYLTDRQNDEALGFLFACLILLLICVAIFAVRSIREHRARMKVRRWMDDAVLLKARTKKSGTHNVLRRYSVVPATAIKISFYYSGKRHTHESDVGGFGRKSNDFIKFANKSLYVLYSPKYDKVMFFDRCKENSIRRQLEDEVRSFKPRKVRAANLQAAAKLKVVPSVLENEEKEL